MKIICPKHIAVEQKFFEELVSGDTFKFKGQLYIKTPTGNVVNLDSNLWSSISEKAVVDKIDFRIICWDESLSYFDISEFKPGELVSWYGEPHLVLYDLKLLDLQNGITRKVSYAWRLKGYAIANGWDDKVPNEPGWYARFNGKTVSIHYYEAWLLQSWRDSEEFSLWHKILLPDLPKTT